MKILGNIESEKDLGGKAKHLLELEKLGFNVPKWLLISQEILLKQLDSSENKNFEKLFVPTEILNQIETFFGEKITGKTFAVRSSAIDEDGKEFSFAGQFETFLHVAFDELEEKIKAIWKSVNSERVVSYRKQNNLPQQFGISVIVQEMIEADVAGVAFGMDPVSGDKKTKIISAVYGLGEGLVSGELNADNFTVSPNGIEKKLTQKNHAFIKNKTGKGIEKVEIEPKKQDISTLSEKQIQEISKVLDELNQSFSAPQDIEFAYQNQTLFLLQTRPITSQKNKQNLEYILWDNSNIVESYPGITTPLTFSFIIKMYEKVYRQFVGLMGLKEKEIETNASVFANTLGLVRGRVYYNLLTWYKMLAMVPGYSINARFMEKMMGVKERFELKENFRMNKSLAWFRIVLMLFKMLKLQINLKKERKRFLAHLNKVMTKYEAIDFENLQPNEIIQHYNNFEKTLLLNWKAPLINDFFAMIWFGMLEKSCTKYCPDHSNIHNDLLCGSQDIISVQPIHKSIAISKMILENYKAHQVFLEKNPDEIWEILSKNKFPKIKNAIENYISLFGNRCVGELKLETISYAQKPELFVKIIKSYVEQKITEKKSHSNIENELRTNAEAKIFKILKGKPIKKWIFKLVLNKARELVSNRENLRYERTRGFGMVRKMFTALGEKWHQKGDLEHPRDIFYTKLEEIKAAEKSGFKPEIKKKIAERKKEFEEYKKQKPPQERFYTYGKNFTDAYIYSAEKLETLGEKLKGIGCCPGLVQAKVSIVKDPNEIDSLKGNILVTSSTDPGWVTLFPTASGILVERGSLLSHSAIVSREMGIPCIVGISGLLRSLKTGDEVLMNGSTGEIKILAE